MKPLPPSTEAALRVAIEKELTPHFVLASYPRLTDRILTAVLAVLPKSEETPQTFEQLDGDWLDKWGACRVCGGEIPHGHMDNCHIFKQEKKIASLEAKLPTPPVRPETT